jgi:hypothetical protein
MDDDKEITGVDANIASLVGPFRNIMSFFGRIRSAKASTHRLEDHPDGLMVPIGILHLRFARWGAALNLAEEVMSLEDLHAALRSREDVSTAKEKLALMANEFESIAKITRGRGSEEGNASATDDYPMTSRVLIQRIRGLADSRQCKTKTLRQVRWHLMLQKICHRSFRRHCKLSAAKGNWNFRDEDESTLTGLINELSSLIGQLEELVPGDGSIATSCCEEENAMLLPLAQPDSVQRHQLILATGRFDTRLERGMGLRRDGTSPSALHFNENGFF